MNYYPYIIDNGENVFKIKEFTKDEIDAIIKKFDVIKINKYLQHVDYFRDLIKMKINDCVSYKSIKKYLIKVRDGIIIKEDSKDIYESQFPKLSKYHNSEDCNVTKYECDKYKITTKENNNKYILFFEIEDQKIISDISHKISN
jgi:hypothetical protein